MSERSAEEDARRRTPDCKPFCLGGWHEETCPVVAERVIPPTKNGQP